MSEEFENRFIRPIINASYPGTLAALNLTVLQVTDPGASILIKMLIALGSVTFLISSYSIFFYSIYPTRTKLWISTAVSFLAGLTFSLIAVIAILIP